MIDTLPSRRSAIFTDTAPRKLPRSFYWGAGVALLLHAGLIYYLVEQNFDHAVIDAPPEGPTIIGTVYTPPKPVQPKPQPATQKPVTQVAIHDTPDPVTHTETVDLTPHPVTPTVADGPPQSLNPPTTSGSDTSAEPGPVYVAPRWKAFPDANTLTDYYPPRALDGEVEGSASVQCTVLDSAGHVRCALVSETPKGYGFGQQTVRMVEEKGRVDTSVGNIKVGSVLQTTTVKWQLN